MWSPPPDLLPEKSALSEFYGLPYREIPVINIENRTCESENWHVECTGRQDERRDSLAQLFLSITWPKVR
ncbi:hypothetical protein QYM36_016989 [Artemia franciscana]|uniref:Uncharacterized protein n=2 Tax=Artemia franciscana TaxID=6661 RepID=A0AA88HC61_ARTSF|nr:hypothetical protein QYM36_016989 [Artemia franciscana]